jgi:hypothetical protein
MKNRLAEIVSQHKTIGRKELAGRSGDEGDEMGSQRRCIFACDLQEARSASEGRGRRRVSRCWQGIHGCGSQGNERGGQELAVVHVGASQLDDT